MTYRTLLLLTFLLTYVAGSIHAQIPLAYVTNNTSDYWTLCRKGTEAAAKHLGTVSVKFIMPEDGTAAMQKRDIDDLLARGVRGIAISPVDPQNETPFLNSVAKKAALITSDSDAAESRRLCYIGTDNRAAGIQVGRLIKAAVPHGGQIMLFVGRKDARNAHDREMGIREALRGTSIAVLGVREDDADHARAMQNVLDTLHKYPHIAALVGLWSYNGPAILSAVRASGKTGKVKIVCFDEEQDTTAGIRSGEIYATVAQQPYLLGYQSILLLARITRGGKSGIPKGKRIVIPTLAIKRNNVNAYLIHQKLLLDNL